jgi:hypothetical protein
MTQRKLAFALVVINNTKGRQELVSLWRCIHPSSWCKSETDNNRERERERESGRPYEISLQKKHFC